MPQSEMMTLAHWEGKNSLNKINNNKKTQGSGPNQPPGHRETSRCSLWPVRACLEEIQESHSQCGWSGKQNMSGHFTLQACGRDREPLYTQRWEEERHMMAFIFHKAISRVLASNHSVYTFKMFCCIWHFWLWKVPMWKSNLQSDPFKLKRFN